MSTGSHHAHNNPKNTRREARELVLRMLYQLDSGKQTKSDVIDEAFSQSHLEGNNRAFATDIINGTLDNIAEIDKRLSCLTEDWAADRQAVVDRNVLRLGAYEILYRPDSPVAAIVNEAVELAKKYSTAESGRFVNGVLGALAKAPDITRNSSADAAQDNADVQPPVPIEGGP